MDAVKDVPSYALHRVRLQLGMGGIPHFEGRAEQGNSGPTIRARPEKNLPDRRRGPGLKLHMKGDCTSYGQSQALFSRTMVRRAKTGLDCLFFVIYRLS